RVSVAVPPDEAEPPLPPQLDAAVANSVQTASAAAAYASRLRRSIAAITARTASIPMGAAAPIPPSPSPRGSKIVPAGAAEPAALTVSTTCADCDAGITSGVGKLKVVLPEGLTDACCDDPPADASACNRESSPEDVTRMLIAVS